MRVTLMSPLPPPLLLVVLMLLARPPGAKWLRSSLGRKVRPSREGA
jgi:hypothetical protein